jgi:hypothetical protein
VTALTIKEIKVRYLPAAITFYDTEHRPAT